MDWKDILTRAAKTFIQAALATLVIVPPLTDVEAWGIAGLAAANAGVAAVISLLQNVAGEKFGSSS